MIWLVAYFTLPVPPTCTDLTEPYFCSSDSWRCFPSGRYHLRKCKYLIKSKHTTWHRNPSREMGTLDRPLSRLCKIGQPFVPLGLKALILMSLQDTITLHSSLSSSTFNSLSFFPNQVHHCLMNYTENVFQTLAGILNIYTKALN